jgi:hypothetical protein
MVMNQLVRMLMGGHVTTSLAEQLPIQRWNGTAGQRRVACLASHLSDPAAKSKMTAWAALEAEVACLYELDADELERIAGRFPLVEKTMRNEAVRRLRRMAARRSRSASDALNETGATRSVPSGS